MYNRSGNLNELPTRFDLARSELRDHVGAHRHEEEYGMMMIDAERDSASGASRGRAQPALRPVTRCRVPGTNTSSLILAKPACLK